MKSTKNRAVVETVSERTIEIRLDSDLDGDIVDELQACLDRHIIGRAITMVIDFAAVSFISSAGIGVIFSRTKRLQQVGGEVVLRNLSDEMKYVLEEIGLLDMFTIE